MNFPSSTIPRRPKGWRYVQKFRPIQVGLDLGLQNPKSQYGTRCYGACFVRRGCQSVAFLAMFGSPTPNGGAGVEQKMREKDEMVRLARMRARSSVVCSFICPGFVNQEHCGENIRSESIPLQSCARGAPPQLLPPI